MYANGFSEQGPVEVGAAADGEALISDGLLVRETAIRVSSIRGGLYSCKKIVLSKKRNGGGLGRSKSLSHFFSSSLNQSKPNECQCAKKLKTVFGP